jgi:GNAT superfamily N-acetyltransferase
MDIVYREYSHERDFDCLCRMVLSLYTEDPEGEEVTVDKVSLTVNEAELNPGKLNIIIFEYQETVIGYAILTFFWSNEYGGDIINIDEIFIAKEYRSKGLATSFINSISTRYPGVKGLKLEASPSNIKAIKGYEKMGFIKAPNIHMIRHP